MSSRKLDAADAVADEREQDCTEDKARTPHAQMAAEALDRLDEAGTPRWQRSSGATSRGGEDQEHARACNREAGNADERHLLEPRKRQQEQACVAEQRRSHAEENRSADVRQCIRRHPGSGCTKLIGVEVHGVVDCDPDQARAEYQRHQMQFTEDEVRCADPGGCAGTQCEQAERRRTPIAEQDQHQHQHDDGSNGAEQRHFAA